MSLPTPNTRKEQYLNAIATGNAGGLPTPITREEEYLDAIAKSGGGSGDGDMKKSVYDSDLAVANAGGISAFVSDAVSGKVDKVEGKGLSTNDYDNTEKGKVADNTSAIEATQDMISDAYDSTTTYAVGDYCIYENALYKCKTASTTGTWDSSKWDAVTVLNEIENMPKIKIGQLYYEEVPVSTSYQGFYFGYTDFITNHGYQGVLIAYTVHDDQATAPYSILVYENRLELISSTSQTVKLTWAPVYI